VSSKTLKGLEVAVYVAKEGRRQDNGGRKAGRTRNGAGRGRVTAT